MPYDDEALAVIGMACLFPGARSPSDYWRNIVAARDLIQEVPPDRWRISDYYDPDPRAPDRTYCRRGGFIAPLDFDPLEFGLQPRNLPATDPAQVLALLVARDALRSAFGDDLARLDRDRTAVVLGASPFMELSGMMGLRASLPLVRRALEDAGLPADTIAQSLQRVSAQVVDWQETTFPGMLSNVIAGRIAGRFDLHGSNFTIDAACASSLTVLGIAADELARGRASAVLCGGSDTSNSGLAFIAFSKTPALSPTEDCRPFSEHADGTLLGEGVAMLVVKRLVDAERDDDTIHAVIRGVATSSDGRAKSIFAPNAAGQELALERAHAAAGVSPRTIELLEAHGTGTRVGDAEEVLSATRVFTRGGRPERPWCALGSVKSQIGHTKCTAGAAGAMKAILALRHGTLPPTIKVDKPNARLLDPGVPFYVNTRARPWIRGPDHPRRAAVTALGFGGTNAHVVLEEYRGPGRRPPAVRTSPSELVALSADDPQGLARACLELVDAARSTSLADLAYRSQRRFDPRAAWRLATVAESPEELARRLAQAADATLNGWPVPRVHLGTGPCAGPVALLFPGQGAQALDMGADLAMAFEVARSTWDTHATTPLLDGFALHEVVFPPPAFDDATRKRQHERLTDTRWAQPALGVAELSTLAVLREIGLEPAMAAGHSFGELVALHVAGVLDAVTLVELAHARGDAIHAAIERGGADGAMLAIAAPWRQVAAECFAAELTLANDNSPFQVVASGRSDRVAQLEAALLARGLSVKRLPVATAFHSPLVADASALFAERLAKARIAPPRLPVFAATTATPHGPDPADIARRLADQIASPVRFRECLLAMHDTGARVFVDVGPGATLARFAEDTLADRPHLVVRLAASGVHGVTAFLDGLAGLCAAGVPLRLGALWDGYDVPAASPAPPGFSVEVSGRVFDAPYPPAAGAPAPAAPPSRRPAPAPSPHLDAVAAIHARLDESQSRFERHMMESHLAFLRLSEAALRELGASATMLAPDLIPDCATPPSAPPASPTPPAPPVPIEATPLATARPIDAAALEHKLLAIVSERTGYPPELLALDMHLEADLGIDSIRRMEILTHFLGLDPTQAAAGLDAGRSAALARLQTLGDVLAYVRSESATLSASPPGHAEDLRGTLHDSSAAHGATVLVRRVVPAPLQPGPRRDPPLGSHVAVIGASPLARALHATLTASGARVTSAIDDSTRAVVHLGPLDTDAGPEPALSLLVDLVHGARRALAAQPLTLERFVVVQQQGGDFGATRLDARTASGGGGGAFLRTLALEHPELTIRLVDVSSGLAPGRAAAHLVDALTTTTGPDELGLLLDDRSVTRALSPAPRSSSHRRRRPSSGLWVVSGGGRGITVDVLRAVARSVRPRLLVLGRTPDTRPSADLPETADLPTLQHALAERATASGAPFDPAALRLEASALARAFELARGLGALAAAGLEFHYASVDVSDAPAIVAAIAEARDAFGPVTGVVHAAGLIADKRLVDKTDAQLRTVFRAKVHGLAALLHATAGDPLEVLCAFSSIAAVRGSAGQVDYAVANQVMTDLLRVEAARRGAACTTHAFALGPVAGGMMSPALQAHYRERGVPILPVAVAAETIASALVDGDHQDVELVIVPSEVAK